MHTETVSSRFERDVDRTGDHHIWTGAVDAVRGTGPLKVRGKNLTAHRVAWELAHGQLPANVRVLACPAESACVRLEHLRVDGGKPARTARNRKGGGSMREVRPGVWKLSATGRFADGTTRRVHRTVHADGRTRAAKELASFVDEVDKEDGLVHREHSRMTVDEAIEVFLSEHLAGEKGREGKTIRDYRALHRKWFSSSIGNRLVREVDRASLDRPLRRHASVGSQPITHGSGAKPLRAVLPVGEGARDDDPLPHGELPAADEPVRVKGPHSAGGRRAVTTPR